MDERLEAVLDLEEPEFLYDLRGIFCGGYGKQPLMIDTAHKSFMFRKVHVHHYVISNSRLYKVALLWPQLLLTPAPSDRLVQLRLVPAKDHTVQFQSTFGTCRWRWYCNDSGGRNMKMCIMLPVFSGICMIMSCFYGALLPLHAYRW